MTRRPYDPKTHWDFMQARVERAQTRQGTHLRHSMDRQAAEEDAYNNACALLEETIGPKADAARAELVRKAEIDGVYCEHPIKLGVLKPDLSGWAMPPVYCGRQLSAQHVDHPLCDEHDPDALSSEDWARGEAAAARDLRYGLRSSRSWDEARGGDDGWNDGD